jgi:pyrroloquinoline quinone biosynthesis protein E
LVAELTYRCPLRCVYCSNPTALERLGAELTTEEWVRALEEAAALGVVQVTFSGGEPLLRPDLEELVRAARRFDLYTSLITSAVPLDEDRLDRLVAAGLDAVQISFQDATGAQAAALAGKDAHTEKLAAASWVRARGLPLTLNVVLHRANLAQVPAIIALAETLGARRLELANTQFLGWALANRDALLPSAAAIDEARALAAAAAERLRGRMEVLFVLPDYVAERPRACMNGWAERYIVVAPDGRVLPCQAAHRLPLEFESVRDRNLGAIWRESPALGAYRGDAWQTWMEEPCRSCERRAIDFGGCRCQAFELTGRATATDPVCPLSPAHETIRAAREAAEAAARDAAEAGSKAGVTGAAPAAPRWVYRRLPLLP